jgi:hypothetical protein
MLEQKNFTFPFEDRDWGNKFVIGSLLHLIAPFLLYLPIVFPRGYSLRVWRDAVQGLSPRLAEWDDWEGMGLRGVVYYAVLLLWSLPVWLVWGAVAVLAVSGGLGVGWIAEASEEGAIAGSLMLAAGLGLAILVAALITFVFGLVYPVAVGRYLEKGRFGAAFELGAVWRITRANLGGWLAAWLVIFVLNLIIGSAVSVLSTVFCWIPFLSYLLMAPAMFYTSLVQARLMGSAYREARRRLEDGGAPVVAPAPPEGGPATGAGEPALAEAPEPIETLRLSVRVQRVLRDAGLTSIDDLLAHLAQGDEALLSIRGIGPKSLAEIRVKLAAGGFLQN